MLKQIRRYGRAFALALKFTLRGEKPPLLKVRDQHPTLAAWWTQTITLVNAAERAAVSSGTDTKAVRVRADRRDVSMATILGTVRFHAEREYPHLFANRGNYDRLTLDALNLNDRYLVMLLINAVDAPLKPSIEALAAHLGSPPPEDNIS